MAAGAVSLPRWLKSANRVIIRLQRMGFSLGTMHVLSIPGRKSGQMRTTPVSLLTLDAQRYVVGGMIEADWVKNARAAGWGILAHGRKREQIALRELPEDERTPVLRAFPVLVPHGVSFFRQMYGLPSDPAALPDAFAALSTQSTVFAVDTLPEETSPLTSHSFPASSR
jgi:deazaflavin-dependent oxidoreductase (nitroreductase family)